MTKEAIILKNKITLVDDYSMIYASILVPKRNIQKLIGLTNCEIISKNITLLPNNHHAGTTYIVDIYARFDKIKDYLNKISITDCDNKDIYLSMLNENKYLSYSDTHLKSEKVKLYAFGDLYIPNNYNYNAIYYNAKGHKISVCHDDWNEHGNKRYINFKGQWFSNKKY